MTFYYGGKNLIWVDGKQVPPIGSIRIMHRVSDLDLISTHNPSEHNSLVRHEGTSDIMTQKPHVSPDDNVRK